jgi:hypothetical protein
MTVHHPSVQFAKLKLILQAKIVAPAELPAADPQQVRLGNSGSGVTQSGKFCAKLNQ